MTQQTPPNYRMLPDRPCCGTCKHRNYNYRLEQTICAKHDCDINDCTDCYICNDWSEEMTQDAVIDRKPPNFRIIPDQQCCYGCKHCKKDRIRIFLFAIFINAN